MHLYILYERGKIFIKLSFLSLFGQLEDFRCAMKEIMYLTDDFNSNLI